MPSIVSQTIEGENGETIELVVENVHDVPLLVSGRVSEGLYGSKRIILTISRVSTFIRSQQVLEDHVKTRSLPDVTDEAPPSSVQKTQPLSLPYRTEAPPEDYVPPARRMHKSITFTETTGRILTAIRKEPDGTFRNVKTTEASLKIFEGAAPRYTTARALASVLWHKPRPRNPSRNKYQTAAECLESWFSRDELSRLMLLALTSLRKVDPK